MKNTLAKIFFILGIGLLFTHQFISHHHHQEMVTASWHQQSNDKSDHEEGLPAHSIDHTFSNTNSASEILKLSPQEIVLLSWFSFQIQRLATEISTCYHVVNIKPPAPDYFSVSSRRGPPSC